MKMPRFFIILGACALLLTACLNYEATTNPCMAGPLPIVRVDPWAGDPEEPGFARGIPFDDEEYSRIEPPYETSALNKPVRRASLRTYWVHLIGLLNWAEWRRM